MSKKPAVCCVKPPEPKFLTEIKKKVGYKEGPTLEDKIAKRPRDDQSDPEDDDTEIPSAAQIVVEVEGDLTPEEVEKLLKDRGELNERKKIDDGKITFKKPIKRDPVESDPSPQHNNKRLATGKADVKPINNSRLLSFEDEDG